MTAAEAGEMSIALIGPYELAFDKVAEALPGSICGVYALGHVDANGTFRVQRVGRDDQDLRRCLQGLIGVSSRFKFLTAGNPQMAFERECELFHRFRPPGNFMHPERPAGSNWRCPVCFQFHSS